MNWEKVKAVNGEWTVAIINDKGKYFLHSKYDPSKEASRWVAQWEMIDEKPSKICVIGIGAGYHIVALREEFPNIPIVVLDFNPDYVGWLKENHLFHRLEDEKISIKISDDLNKISKDFLPLLDEIDTMVMIHSPSLELIPNKLSSLKERLDEFYTFLKTVRKNKEILEQNFVNNLKLNDKSILKWRNYLIGKSSILVSAGPSLTKQLPLLKEVYKKGDIFIACVGTALIPLLNFGIIPNAIMISDAQDTLLEQFKGTSNIIDVPLFYLATANHKAVSGYTGKRYIVWQQDYSISRIQADLIKEPTIRTGGSVATCLLDLLVWMGSSRVALVGQDLSFTGGYSHAVGSHNVKKVNSENIIEVTDYYQREKVKTKSFLLGYLRWFERYVIDTSSNAEFWNCTEGGAYIEGWKHKRLKEFIEEKKGD